MKSSESSDIYKQHMAYSVSPSIELNDKLPLCVLMNAKYIMAAFSNKLNTHSVIKYCFSCRLYMPK